MLIDMTNIHVGRRVVAFDKSCGTRKGNSLVYERAFWSSSSAQLHAKLFGLSTSWNVPLQLVIKLYLMLR